MTRLPTAPSALPAASSAGPATPAERFDALFAREFPRVARSVYLVLGDADLAQDITQDAFVSLLLVSVAVAGLGCCTRWSAVPTGLRRRHRCPARPRHR